MLLPNLVHGIHMDPFRLRQEHHDEHRHYQDPAAVKQERTILETAKRGEERLRKSERCGEVHGDAQALTSRSHLEREYLTRDQPAQWAPRPSKASRVYA